MDWVHGSKTNLHALRRIVSLGVWLNPKAHPDTFFSLSLSLSLPPSLSYILHLFAVSNIFNGNSKITVWMPHPPAMPLLIPPLLHLFLIESQSHPGGPPTLFAQSFLSVVSFHCETPFAYLRRTASTTTGWCWNMRILLPGLGKGDEMQCRLSPWLEASLSSLCLIVLVAMMPCGPIK